MSSAVRQRGSGRRYRLRRVREAFFKQLGYSRSESALRRRTKPSVWSLLSASPARRALLDERHDIAAAAAVTQERRRNVSNRNRHADGPNAPAAGAIFAGIKPNIREYAADRGIDGRSRRACPRWHDERRDGDRQTSAESGGIAPPHTAGNESRLFESANCHSRIAHYGRLHISENRNSSANVVSSATTACGRSAVASRFAPTIAFGVMAFDAIGAGDAASANMKIARTPCLFDVARVPFERIASECW